MTPELAAMLDRASRAVAYPARGYVENLDGLAAAVATYDRDAADRLATFADSVRGHSVEALQELFTQTFDMNPLCALEVGWHLFGEDYERGAFLVRMRQSLRDLGIDEAGELPDHLAAMLQLAARPAEADAGILVANALLPATAKMLENLQASASPFHPVVGAIRTALAAVPATAEAQHV